jgi:hypothetical protein
MPSPTPDRFRGLARSSPWRWRALELDFHRRPLHGAEHSLHAAVERGVGVTVRLADGECHTQDARRTSVGWSESDTDRQVTRELPFAWELPAEVDADGFVLRRPSFPGTSDDPMWQDYQFVAMLDPVELADGRPPPPSPGEGPDDACPPALDVHHLDATSRNERETWWARVSPRDDYSPRCSCCPLLFGEVSEALEVAEGGGPTVRDRGPDPAHATAYLVALDVATGVCVHVEHLDGDHAGRGFSVDLLTVDGR